MSDEEMPKRIVETQEFFEKLEKLLEHDVENMIKHLEHIDAEVVADAIKDPLLRSYALSWLDDSKSYTGIMQRNLRNLFRLIKEAMEAG